MYKNFFKDILLDFVDLHLHLVSNKMTLDMSPSLATSTPGFAQSSISCHFNYLFIYLFKISKIN